MIIRPRPSLLTLFLVMRGSIVPRVLPKIAGFALFAVAVVAFVRWFGFDMAAFNLTPFGLIGVTLSIYLGFRNSAAYDRWWEGRKLWGQLVFEVRNLARATVALLDEGERQAFLMDALAFCHLLRGQLRHVEASGAAAAFVGGTHGLPASQGNQADAVVRRMGKRIAAAQHAGALNPIGFRILDERLSALSAVQAGCERIAGTPLPFAYTLLLQRTATIFCLLLPFGLVGSMGWATPLFTALVTYTFFGLDALSEELEDPFGTEANDLALDALCRVCEISVFDALDLPPPAPLPVADFYLS